MKYYLSVDIGGTKTAFLLTDEFGTVVGKHLENGCTYSVMGKEAIYKLLKRGAEEILRKYHVLKKDLRYIVWGIACFGEYKILDSYLSEMLPLIFPCECYLCNDVEIGLAGSLLLKSGVHIVSGTGAIVMGKSENGDKARANGWHEVFSDEGSAHWLGRETLSLFTKQADGRVEKSFLYHLFYRYFQFVDDMDIVLYYKEHLEGSRKRIAELQKILLEAARQGDKSAVCLYKRAAKELKESVNGVAKQLQMGVENLVVSYYGGTFKAGEFILEPLAEYLSKQGTILLPPQLSPECGGILMAAEHSDIKNMDTIVKNLKKYESKQV